VKEVDGVFVQLQRKRFQKRYVIGHNFLVGEVELVDDDGVHVVVGQKVI
jgi:hypothetical protein